VLTTTAGTVVEPPALSIAGMAVFAFAISVEPKDVMGRAADSVALTVGDPSVSLTPALVGMFVGVLTEETSLLGTSKLRLADGLLSGRIAVGTSLTGSLVVGLIEELTGSVLEAPISKLDTIATLDGVESESAGIVLLEPTDVVDGSAAGALEFKREPITPPTLSPAEWHCMSQSDTNLKRRGISQSLLIWPLKRSGMVQVQLSFRSVIPNATHQAGMSHFEYLREQQRDAKQ